MKRSVNLWSISVDNIPADKEHTNHCKHRVVAFTLRLISNCCNCYKLLIRLFYQICWVGKGLVHEQDFFRAVSLTWALTQNQHSSPCVSCKCKRTSKHKHMHILNLISWGGVCVFNPPCQRSNNSTCVKTRIFSWWLLLAAHESPCCGKHQRLDSLFQLIRSSLRMDVLLYNAVSQEELLWPPICHSKGSDRPIFKSRIRIKWFTFTYSTFFSNPVLFEEEKNNWQSVVYKHKYELFGALRKWMQVRTC